MKQAIEKLQAENRELSRRVKTLEADIEARKKAAAGAPRAKKAHLEQKPAPSAVAQATPPPAPASAAPATPPGAAAASPAPPANAETVRLEQRVQDLETAQVAQESAVRRIISDTLSKVGPRINEAVTLGGSLEVLAGRNTDFTGETRDTIALNTAELDFDIRAGDWVGGSLIVQYDNGSNVLFPTTNGFNTSVDRINLERGTVTVGDVQRFPLYAHAGLDTLSFGTSTGVHRNDVLSITNPLTIEAFETRRPEVEFGFALPTPKVGPLPPPVVVPTVQPQVITPLVRSMAGALGYHFPAPPTQPVPTSPPPEPPPFYGSIAVYDSSTPPGISNSSFSSNIDARLGYRTGGHCGKTYDELRNAFVCPWSFDANLDYNSSIFNSRFLSAEYEPFLSQIGFVPAIGASVKAALGRFALVGEWNGAVRAAKFHDGLGNPVSITPGAWQAAIAYQFDWNPWIETIGAQGNYLAVGVSGSYGLAGVTEVLSDGSTVRVGAVPKRRLTLTAAEWVDGNTKLTAEFAHDWDYPVSEGGTGNQANGFFTTLTYNW